MGETANPALVIFLNGPPGIGKSTLAELFAESTDRTVWLNGDTLSALNPPPEDELEALNQTLAVLVFHHMAQGYRRFIIDHFWASPSEIEDLRSKLASSVGNLRLEVFRLTLDEENNRKRIEKRRAARAIDEAAEEDANFDRESKQLRASGDTLGQPFDASDAPQQLVARLQAELKIEP